jgi:hypothetical protein
LRPPGLQTHACVADADAADTLARLVSAVDSNSTLNGSGLGSSRFAFAHLRGYYEHLDGAAKRWAAATGASLGSTPAAEAEAEFETFRAKKKKKETEEGRKTTDADVSDSDASDSGASDSGASDASYDDVEESVARDAALLDLDANVGKVWDAAPSGSMLLLVTGVGNAPLVKIMQERKWKRAQALGPWGKWTDEAEAELRAEAERARRGMLFAAVKNDDDGDDDGEANAGDADDGTR